MSSTFETLYTDVARAIGRYDADGNIDTDGLAVSKRGVNFGALFAALVFEPLELNTSRNLTASSSANYVALSTLTSLRLIQSIYNSTGARDVRFLPEEKFKLLVPTSTVYVEYYYRHGNTLYYNQPSASNTLLVKYIKYPTELVNAEDVLEFSNHDSVVHSIATSYAHAVFEEGESQKMWDGFLQVTASAYGLNTQKVKEMKEALKSSGYNV